MRAAGRRRQYKPADYATPYEKLKSMPEAKQYRTVVPAAQSARAFFTVPSDARE